MLNRKFFSDAKDASFLPDGCDHAPLAQPSTFLLRASVAREVAGDYVTINTVQPGTHATNRITQLYGAVPDAKALDIPAGVVGDPKDFGDVVAFLCSESAKFITGANLQVDGGQYSGLI